MTTTQTTTKSKPGADAPAPPPRIGRPTRYEGEKDKKLTVLTLDAISIANQIAEREGCTFSNAVELAIREAGAARKISEKATVRA